MPRTYVEQLTYGSTLGRPSLFLIVKIGELIRASQMTGYHWREVARDLVRRHPLDVAEALLNEHGRRRAGERPWFLDHRNTKDLLFRAAELDPLGTWRLVSVHLSDEKEGRRFAVGFPRGLLDRLPLSNVWEWIVEEPRKRAGTDAAAEFRRRADGDREREDEERIDER